MAMLGRDFLAPVMARWVLVDVAYGTAFPFNLAAHAARWVPTDRVAALEQAWETAWREEAHSTTFSAPFTAMWGERQARRLPLLFRNGTMRESGLPVVTAPVTIGSGGVRATRDALELLQADVALSTAVTNAARFPYIAPNGVVRMTDAQGTATGLEDSIVDGELHQQVEVGHPTMKCQPVNVATFVDTSFFDGSADHAQDQWPGWYWRLVPQVQKGKGLRILHHAASDAVRRLASMLEEVHRHLEMGGQPFQAVIARRVAAGFDLGDVGPANPHLLSEFLLSKIVDHSEYVDTAPNRVLFQSLAAREHVLSPMTVSESGPS